MNILKPILRSFWFAHYTAMSIFQLVVIECYSIVILAVWIANEPPVNDGTRIDNIQFDCLSA